MIVALLALVVALGGVAYASIPAPNGTFKTCFNDATGVVRVIDSSASCSAGETGFRIASPRTIDLLRPYGAVRVDSTGKTTLVASDGIKSVTRVRTGTFCVQTVLPFKILASPVSPAFDPHGVAVAYAKLAPSDCSVGQLEVITGRIVKGSFQRHDESFYADPTG